MSKRRSAARRRPRGKTSPAPPLAAAAPIRRRPSLDEIGGTGLRTSGGKILEEYNPDLKGPKLYADYDRMLRGDGQIQAIELVVTLPIEATAWRVDPHPAGEPIDLEIADALATNLFDGMSCSWEDVVAETMMSPLMGVNLLEKVYERRDGQDWLRKLAPRHPRTIEKWILDPEGGVQGIVQRVTDPTTGRVDDKPIPIERLLRFTYRGRGGNPEGIGLMRAMRSHWVIKHALWNIANVGMETLYNPPAVGHLPDNYTQSDRDQYMAILRHFGKGIALPPGYVTPEFPAGNQRLPNILSYIQYHDTLIARSALAQFLQLGSGETGSWALSDSHVTLFLMALEQMVVRIAGVFDRYLIPEWVGYSYPGVDRFPRMGWSPIAHIMQRAAILQTLQGLATGKLIEIDDDIEALIRDMLGLPEKTGGDDEGDVDETIPQEDIGASRRYRQPVRSSRHSRPPIHAAARERQRPRDQRRFDRDQSRLDAAKKSFQTDMTELVKRQHAALKKTLAPLIEEFKAASDLSKGSVLRKMQRLEVPLVGKYENLIAAWLRRFYQTAVERAAEEAGIEPPKTISNAVRTWFATRAQAIAQKHAEALRAAVLFEALDIVRKDIPTKQVLWNAEQQARQRANLDIRDDLMAAGNELVDLINDALAEVEIEAPE